MGSLKPLHLFGVNFRTASIAVRESLSCDRDRASELLRLTAAHDPRLEAVVLSTCNRTELYVAAPTNELPIEVRLRRSPLGTLALLKSDTRYQTGDDLAVRHLCRVACGLDSAVLGDTQVLGQVKSAFTDASRVGSLGGALHEAFVRAIGAGKRARNMTAISRGAASVGAALVEMMLQRRHDVAPDALHVVVLGAGKVAGQICRHLAKRGIGRMTIVNRTEARAASLARECGAQTAPLANSEALMRRADVIVTAVRSEKPILLGETLQRLVASRNGQGVLVVDAGLPRNVEVIPGVEILNVDSVVARRHSGLQERRAAVPAVERIVEEAVAEWTTWCASQPLERAIKELFAQVERVSRQNASQLASISGMSDSEAKTALIKGFKRQLHPYVRELRTR